MQPTDILFDEQVREKLLKGVRIMEKAVSSTLGPRGRNVAIARSNRGEVYDRTTLHDGVSVARAIQLQDEFENMGAQLLVEASQKQVDLVGDGTTVVMILARAIIEEYMILIAAGINPMALRMDLEEKIDKLIKALEPLAIPVNPGKELNFVASISAGNTELGEMIAKAFTIVGKDGVVTAENSKSPTTSLEHQEGMQLDKGMLHPWLVTNPDRMEAVLENAYFLITDKPITSFADIQKFLIEFVKMSRQLVIISPDISGDALPLLIQNKLEGKFGVILIQAPSFGEDQKNILQDIAILTGGKFLSQDAGYKFEDLSIDDLGFAESITSTKDETIIVKGRGSKEEIDKRISQIKTQLETEEGDFNIQRLKSRLGKLTNGVVIIRVGGQTEIEMKERRERVLDSIAATRAALEKGIVAGGEVVYLQIREQLGDSLADKILYKALAKPFDKLVENAGLEPGELRTMLKHKIYRVDIQNAGVDVTTGEIKDMVKAGIVDPVLVSINALKNAISVALQIVMTGTEIVPHKETVKNEKV